VRTHTHTHAHTPQGAHKPKKYVDVWVVDDWGFDGFESDLERSDQTVMLLFQFGYILADRLEKDGIKLRVLYVPSKGCLDSGDVPTWNPVHDKTIKSLKDGLAEYCYRMRVTPHETHVVDPRSGSSTANTGGWSEEDVQLMSRLYDKDATVGTRARALGALIAMHSDNTAQIFAALPEPPAATVNGAESALEYVLPPDTTTTTTTTSSSSSLL
jgi:hypothetical protein